MAYAVIITAVAINIADVAIGRRVTDLDEALSDAALQIGIGETEGHAHVPRQIPLTHVTALADGVQQFQDQLVLTFTFSVHLMNTIR